MTSLTELIASWVVTTVLTFAVIMLDERWMKPERLERAWPPSSRDAAIVAFGPLAILVHFLRTRGGFRSARMAFLGIPLGLGMGVVALFAVSIVGSIVVNIVLMIAGQPVDWSFE